ncbi:MAG: heat-inducible transcription repressor HrcA [Armatimonadetes bacterium]|nr:heat-inducible transcription repressor HrcA [Armatimonadota bacterium]
MLDARQQTILGAVIAEYVASAEPVASELITQKYSLGVKSATIRNELSYLSELGYLEQPHLSAGRIPSDQGYRFFVDWLLRPQEIDAGTRSKIRQSGSDGEAALSLLRDTARSISRASHLMAVATLYRDALVTVRTALVSGLSAKQALLVLALSNGHIENRVIECPEGLSLDNYGEANEILNRTLASVPLRSISRMRAPGASNSQTENLLATLWGPIKAVSRDLTRGRVIAEGAEFMIAQPEFRKDVASLTSFLEWFSGSDELYEALATQGDGAQTVTIGRENRHERMQTLSLVKGVFNVCEVEAGVIALLGPTRMRYEVAVPMVKYTASVLTHTLTRLLS